MKKGSKVEFDEEIIVMSISLIRNLKIIPSITIDLFKTLPNYIRKISGLTPELAELLNLIIVYGQSNYLYQNETFCSMILTITKKVLSNDYEYNYSKLQLAMILINVLTNEINNFSKLEEHYISNLILYLTKRIKEEGSIIKINKSKASEIKKIRKKYNYSNNDFKQNIDNNNNIKILNLSNDYDNNSFVGIISCIYAGFFNYPKETFISLRSNNFFVDLISYTEVILKLKYIPPIFLKTITLGISSWLNNVEIINEYKEIFNYLLQLSIKGLLLQRVIDENELHEMLLFTEMSLQNYEDKNNDITFLSKKHKKDIANSDDEYYSSDDNLEDNSESFDDEYVSEVKAHTEKNIIQNESNFISLTNKNVKTKNKLKNNIDNSNILNKRDLNEVFNRHILNIKSIDEYLIFNKVYHTNNFEVKNLFNNFIQSYSNQTKIMNELNTILNLKRVDITNINNTGFTVPRRVVKLKRKIV